MTSSLFEPNHESGFQEKDDKITVHTGVELEKIEGFVGNFKSTITNGTAIEHGIIIVATGGKEYEPTEYLYGNHPNVMTAMEFQQQMENI